MEALKFIGSLPYVSLIVDFMRYCSFSYSALLMFSRVFATFFNGYSYYKKYGIKIFLHKIHEIHRVYETSR